MKNLKILGIAIIMAAFALGGVIGAIAVTPIVTGDGIGITMCVELLIIDFILLVFGFILYECA